MGMAFLRRHPVYIRQYLPEKIKNLGIGRTGNVGIGELQARSDRLGGLRFSGSGGAAQQEIAHGLRGSRCFLDMLADTDDLLRDHIPFRQLRYHCFFFLRERTVRKGILADKIRMCGGDGRSSRRRAGRQYLEIAVQNL